MPYIEIDREILYSSLWPDKTAFRIFFVALCLSRPKDYGFPVSQINLYDFNPTGWSAPPDTYGYVSAASDGLIDIAGYDTADGVKALTALGSPDYSSKSRANDGRRMIRIETGFLILNYWKYVKEEKREKLAISNNQEDLDFRIREWFKNNSSLPLYCEKYLGMMRSMIKRAGWDAATKAVMLAISKGIGEPISYASKIIDGNLAKRELNKPTERFFRPET